MAVVIDIRVAESVVERCFRCMLGARQYAPVLAPDLEFQCHFVAPGSDAAQGGHAFGQIFQVLRVASRLHQQQAGSLGHLAVHQFLYFVSRLPVGEGRCQHVDQQGRQCHPQQQTAAQGTRLNCLLTVKQAVHSVPSLLSSST